MRAFCGACFATCLACTHDAPHVVIASTPSPSASIATHDHAKPADAAWCARIAKDNARIIDAERFDEDAGCYAAEVECAANDAGAAWGFRVRSASAKVDNTECNTTLRVELVRSDGSTFVSPAIADAGRDLVVSGQKDFRWHVDRTTVAFVGDLNDDGDQEVIVTFSSSEHEGPRTHDAIVWTLADRSLVPYGPTRRIDIVATEDIDGDGRMDFITRGPYAKVEAMSQAFMFAYPIGPTLFAVHSKRGGELSTDDAAVIAYAHTHCQAKESDKSTEIVCARLSGQSEADVIAAEKRGGCVDFDEDASRYPQSCAKWIPELAHVTPPFRIPP